MAMFPNGSSATWALSLKALLASTLVISAAVLLKLSLPAAAAFVTSEVPSIYAHLLAWLRPPYLYILVNCIIISIVASSRLHHGADDGDGDGDGRPAPGVAAAMYAAPPAEAAVRAAAEEVMAPEVAGAGYGGYGDGYGARLVEVVGVGAYGAGALEEAGAEKADDEAVVAGDGGDEPMVPEPASPLRRNDSSDFSSLSPNEDRRDKPPVSTRFGHRKPAKSNPEVGRQLRVSGPKRNDTLESTWRTITDGRATPLARHLRKSDTWDSHGRRNDENSPPPPPPQMKKSDTFATRPVPTNRPASPSPGSGRLRTDPSLGQDDLNRHFEAFIRKIKEQMRLQRQESLDQFQQMINRGAG